MAYGDWQKVNDPGGPQCGIQWKGTDVCIDLYCDCGQHHHYDGCFLNAWKCGACGQIWEMGWEVKMRPAREPMQIPCQILEVDLDNPYQQG